jgi:hypothetical protein
MKIKFSIFLILLFISAIGIGQDVYKTPSGKKYHLSTCKMVENVSEKITIEEALNLGLTPCLICKAPAYASITPMPFKQPQGEELSVQCKGQTKAGTRCKHMTRIGNGYCYQHQPGKT